LFAAQQDAQAIFSTGAKNSLITPAQLLHNSRASLQAFTIRLLT